MQSLQRGKPQTFTVLSSWGRSRIISIGGICTVLLLLLWTTSSHTQQFWQMSDKNKHMSIGGGVSLRILPLGDSITEGYQSSDRNGYRLRLREKLLGSGSEIVHFIGSQTDGENNPESRHEGHGGYRLVQIIDFLREHDEKSLQQHPNVVLLHAGTNDVNGDPPEEPYETAPERLAALIDLVLGKCPDAVVLVAKIIDAAFSQARVDAYNAKIPALVARRREDGHRIVVVDHTNVGGKHLKDGLHPNDEGYEIMAENWFEALRGLPSGWIKAPIGTNE